MRREAAIAWGFMMRALYGVGALRILAGECGSWGSILCVAQAYCVLGPAVVLHRLITQPAPTIDGHAVGTQHSPSEMFSR
jgi:hypothetical protein